MTSPAHFRVRFVALVLLAGVAACTSGRGYRSQTEADEACRATEDCSGITLDAGVILSPQDQCWALILRRRCNPYDKCILKCLLSGDGRSIGGGCWHLCGHIFVSVNGTLYPCPSTPIPGWEACEATSPGE